jgi:hypothetical protein
VPEPDDSTLDALIEVAPDEIVHEGRRDLAAVVIFAVFVGVDRLVRVRAARRATRDRTRPRPRRFRGRGRSSPGRR